MTPEDAAPGALLDQLHAELEAADAVTSEDLDQWQAAARSFVKPIAEAVVALRDLTITLDDAARSTDRSDLRASVVHIVDTMRSVAERIDSIGAPRGWDRSKAMACIAHYKARAEALAAALTWDATPSMFANALADVHSPGWRVDVATHLAARLVVELGDAGANVARSFVVVARTALSDAGFVLESGKAFDDDLDRIHASELLQRCMDAEARVAAMALERLPRDAPVEDFDPKLLPQPRRWGPYPGLCHKLEREELLATFVSYAREHGGFGWVSPTELLAHAVARRFQWAERGAALPSTVPSCRRDGFEHGLLDEQADLEAGPNLHRYRVSRPALRMLLVYVAARGSVQP
jgi:hypothetical protein